MKGKARLIPYILLILIPMLCLFVAVKYDTNSGRKVLVHGQTDFVKNNNIAIAVYFFLYFLLLALRHIDIGNDTAAYERHFIEYSTWSITDILEVDSDMLYVLLNWVVGQFISSFRLFLVLISAICIIPLVYVYCKDKEYSYIKILLFSTLTPFIMYFSGIRQGIAMSIGMIAYTFVKEKRIIYFVITVLIAMGFHHSAFILFLMYPLYYATFKKKYLLIVVPSIIMVFVFNKSVFSFLTRVLSFFSDDYLNVTITDTGSFGSLVLFILFAVFCYLIPDETKMNREMMGLRNFLIFAVLLQCFAPINTLAMRFNYYYILFIPIIIPKLITVRSYTYRQIAIWGGRVIVIFFAYKYFNNLFTSLSTLNTIPYKFFWQ